MKRYHIIASGRVQGVGFRYFVLLKANTLNLTGTVRNQSNGNVEIFAQGQEEHKEKAFYDNLIKYITRSPLCAVVLEGENAVEEVRRINGATDPEKAEEGTIRKRFAVNKTENSVHSSDSKASAEREIALWF